MSHIIYSADSIARQLQRGVLYCSFKTPQTDPISEFTNSGYEKNETRIAFLKFLESHKIEYQRCAPCEPTEGNGWLVGYFGHIFVDVPYDVENPQYKLVQQFLEHDDGTMRYEDTNFYYVSLEECS